MAGPPTPGISASNLTAVRRGQTLFKGLDLTLAPGDALHVQGANGSGKSTLLRILAGLLKPAAGEVSVSGSVGYVGHENGFALERTLGSELAFWLGSPPPLDVQSFGLSGLTGVPLRMLSQGQRRRAALWRLTAAQLPIWLLDEPGAGLDQANRAALADAIALHRRRGGIAVIASHGETPLGEIATLTLGAPA